MQKQTSSENNPTIKKLAAVLGLLQGVSWMFLSILCIIFYIKEVENISVRSYMDEVKLNIYTLFLINDGNHIDGQITTASVFAGFMWAYLVLDIVWVFTSFNILAKKQNSTKSALRLWSLATSLVCLLDLILVILLSVDYQNCFNKASSAPTAQLASEQLCANIILPVLIIAGKGFTLWVVNASFALALFKISKQQPNNVETLRLGKSQSDIVSSPQPYFQVEHSQFSPNPSVHSPQARRIYNQYPNMQRRSQLEHPFALRSPPRRF